MRSFIFRVISFFIGLFFLLSGLYLIFLSRSASSLENFGFLAGAIAGAVFVYYGIKGKGPRFNK